MTSGDDLLSGGDPNLSVSVQSAESLPATAKESLVTLGI